MKISTSRKKFAAALKELIQNDTLEEVTTEEIVATAGLSRQTFYKNFVDKYELAFWVYEYEITPIFERYLNGEISFREMNLAMLDIFRADQSFYKNLFHNFELQNSFYQQYHNFCMDNWPKTVGRQRNNTALFRVYELYSYGCNHMTMNWAINGMKESNEEMADLYDAALPECLRFIV